VSVVRFRPRPPNTKTPCRSTICTGFFIFKINCLLAYVQTFAYSGFPFSIDQHQNPGMHQNLLPSLPSHNALLRGGRAKSCSSGRSRFLLPPWMISSYGLMPICTPCLHGSVRQAFRRIQNFAGCAIPPLARLLRPLNAVDGSDHKTMGNLTQRYRESLFGHTCQTPSRFSAARAIAPVAATPAPQAVRF
jgi:hypothetical protein